MHDVVVFQSIGSLVVNRIGRWETLAFVVGFGAVAATLWEVAEYFAVIRHSSELDAADTLGDVTLGLTGLSPGRSGSLPGAEPIADVDAVRIGRATETRAPRPVPRTIDPGHRKAMRGNGSELT